MDIQSIITAVTTVGFPIVMCGVMAYYVKYITDKNREQIEDINEKHATEINEITTAINAILSSCLDIVQNDRFYPYIYYSMVVFHLL